jgi:hypothetical protein
MQNAEQNAEVLGLFRVRRMTTEPREAMTLLY